MNIFFSIKILTVLPFSLLYNCDYGRISDVIPAHDDAVSALSLVSDLGILISGSWDCSVK